MIRDLIVNAVGAFGGTIGLSLLLNAPPRSLLPAAATGMLGQVIYVFLCRYAGASLLFSYFLATVVMSVICEVAARVMRMPSTILLLSALVPLVPGYNFYAMMLALVQDNGRQAASLGMEAMIIVASIAVGAAVTSVVFRAISMRRRRRA
ncbi:MAG: threonine/serine exporter family protein [Clostridia bacterium]|nr:threonine/serine exporter family protein [Clostridia bacterium]